MNKNLDKFYKYSSALTFKVAVKKAIKSPGIKFQYRVGGQDYNIGVLQFNHAINKIIFNNGFQKDVYWSKTRAMLYGTTSYLKKYGL